MTEEKVKKMLQDIVLQCNKKSGDYRRTVSSSEDDKCEIKADLNKNHLLHNVHSLQHRVNNLSIKKIKRSFAHFKVKQQNLLRQVLIDTGNLAHSAIVLGAFWEYIGGKISSSMDYKVRTTDGQSKGLQVLGVGEPWPIHLEGMEETCILEP